MRNIYENSLTSAGFLNFSSEGPFCTFFLRDILFGIDIPNIVFDASSFGDVFDTLHCGEHGMILIIVAVHSIPSHEKKDSHIR